jgi:hypothetical protein
LVVRHCLRAVAVLDMQLTVATVLLVLVAVEQVLLGQQIAAEVVAVLPTLVVVVLFM